LGLITAFLLCSAIFFVQEFHLAVPDPYLIFFVSFALFNFYDFYHIRRLSEVEARNSNLIFRKNYLSWLLFYTSLGLGVLAKGPVAIALPGLIILVFLI